MCLVVGEAVDRAASHTRGCAHDAREETSVERRTQVIRSLIERGSPAQEHVLADFGEGIAAALEAMAGPQPW